MSCYSPIRLTIDGEIRRVPCGGCLGCRIDYSKSWAVRCLHESRYHKQNCFVTFTYSDDELKYGRESPTLWKRDLQLFFKRLRKAGYAVRYFACGEYGDLSFRPHYHACLFGVDFADKVEYSQKGDVTLFSSVVLDNIWSHGHCVIGEMTIESAAYIARYCLKKLKVDSRHFYSDVGIEPEFLIMSRRPGIGRLFFEDYYSDIFSTDSCVTLSGVYSVPRYYSSLLSSVDPDLFSVIKSKRLERSKLVHASDKSYKRLAVKGRVKSAQIRALKRSI